MNVKGEDVTPVARSPGRLITLQCDCEPLDGSTDTLMLNRRPMLERSVDHIINGRGRRLRQLVAPVLVRRGSVRQAG